MEALWDTGAQACLINEEWRKTNLPHHTVTPLDELLESETLIGLAANQTQIPFLGWVEVEFRLGKVSAHVEPLLVPILVSSDQNVAEQPIIGFNVIEAVLGGEDMRQPKTETILILSRAFSVTFKTARSMLKLIQNSETDVDVGMVHSGKRRIRLAAEPVTVVYVKVNTGAQFRGQDLLLVPSEEPTLPEGVKIEEGLTTVPSDRSMYMPVPTANTNKQDITLSQRTVLCRLQIIKTAYTVKTEQVNIGEEDKQPDIREGKEDNKQSDTTPTEVKNKPKTQKPAQWDPPVDLSHLTVAQKATVR